MTDLLEELERKLEELQQAALRTDEETQKVKQQADEALRELVRATRAHARNRRPWRR